MTQFAVGDGLFSVDGGALANLSITETGHYLRIVLGGESDGLASAIALVESHKAQAVLDIRPDGVMRFATNGSWCLWVCEEHGVRRYAHQGVALCEFIKGSAAMVVSGDFSADERWFREAISNGAGDAPACVVVLSEAGQLF